MEKSRFLKNNAPKCSSSLGLPGIWDWFRGSTEYYNIVQKKKREGRVTKFFLFVDVLVLKLPSAEIFTTFFEPFMITGTTFIIGLELKCTNVMRVNSWNMVLKVWYHEEKFKPLSFKSVLLRVTLLCFVIPKAIFADLYLNVNGQPERVKYLS